MKQLTQNIKKIENEILNIRTEFKDKSIWLFILIVSIDSLSSQLLYALKLFAYAIAIIIYFYYLQVALGEKGNLSNRYQVLIDSLELNTTQYECMVCLIERSKTKMKKVVFYDFIIFLLPILFCIFSIYQFFLS